jgi:polyisoprenoid-binding protein YceI
MKCVICAAVLFSIAISGCSSQSSTADTGESQANAAIPKTEAGATTEAAPIKPALGGGTEVALSPANTKIQFVGNHTGNDPNPRTGTFEEFSGKAMINEGKLSSLDVDIQTKSVKTQIEKLTNHLKSADFFNVREHPKATFQSTAIEADGADKLKITGNLTLLGVSQPISFPATVSTKDGLSLQAAFNIDRTKFGMDFGLNNVEKEVEMTVTVGK